MQQEEESEPERLFNTRQATRWLKSRGVKITTKALIARRVRHLTPRVTKRYHYGEAFYLESDLEDFTREFELRHPRMRGLVVKGRVIRSGSD